VRYVATDAASPGDSYVGYAIGRAVGSAVTRNRIRRRLRAILAELGADLPPGSYLFGVRSDRAATAPFDALRTEVRDLVSRSTYVSA
jgi:ribonuclease P protein component